jgi:precorrin-3B C17-methyltransferase
MNDDERTLGTLFVVGLGPGSPSLLTRDAAAALDDAEVVIGYHGYLASIADRIGGKQVIGRELGAEVERARLAIEQSELGKRVALVSSGDAGIYGMGGVVHELAAELGSSVEIVVIPGVTAACSAAAKLGAPLAHDWACISLSDLLTPWETIVRRVEAAARADFVLVLYNPASRGRPHQLTMLAERLLNFRDPNTLVGLVENAYREGERVEVVSLHDLALGRPAVNMFTTVVVGSSQTFLAQGRLITPRIHNAKSSADREPPPTLDGSVPHDPGERIMAESLAMIDAELGIEPRDHAERAIVRRVIHASADFDFARSLRFSPGAIAAAVNCLRRRKRGTNERPPEIVTDVEMLRAGIRRDLAAPLGVAARCFLSDRAAAGEAGAQGLTRAAAGIRRAAMAVGDNTIVAIGNAPTALEEALRLIREQDWRPVCIVGIPVGFVGVEAAKRRLVEESEVSGVPFITSLGRKGGTAVVAAVVNALLDLAALDAEPISEG